jgi:hypothetical protein
VWIGRASVRVAAAGEVDGLSVGCLIEQAVETLADPDRDWVELDLAGVDHISAAAAAKLRSVRSRIADRYQSEPGS